MKLVLKTALFHITCILFFSFIYFSYKEDFIPVDKTEKYNNFIDFLNLSLTIQSSVGMTYIIPHTFITKVFIMIQQILVILTHLITLYFFTL
jgi:hypothetical protein